MEKKKYVRYSMKESISDTNIKYERSDETMTNEQ